MNEWTNERQKEKQKEQTKERTIERKNERKKEWTKERKKEIKKENLWNYICKILLILCLRHTKIGKILLHYETWNDLYLG